MEDVYTIIIIIIIIIIKPIPSHSGKVLQPFGWADSLFLAWEAIPCKICF